MVSAASNASTSNNELVISKESLPNNCVHKISIVPEEENDELVVRHDTLLSEIEIKKDDNLDSPLRRRLNKVRQGELIV